MKFHAGEIHFSGLKSILSLERSTFVTSLRIVDTEGNPVQWARVYNADRFIGSTDKEGKLPIRWQGNQPAVVIKLRDAFSTGLLVPGEMEIVIETQI